MGQRSYALLTWHGNPPGRPHSLIWNCFWQAVHFAVWGLSPAFSHGRVFSHSVVYLVERFAVGFILLYLLFYEKRNNIMRNIYHNHVILIQCDPPKSYFNFGFHWNFQFFISDPILLSHTFLINSIIFLTQLQQECLRSWQSIILSIMMISFTLNASKG